MQNKREDGVFLCATTPGRVVSMWAGRRETQGDIEFVNVVITARQRSGVVSPSPNPVTFGRLVNPLEFRFLQL